MKTILCMAILLCATLFGIAPAIAQNSVCSTIGLSSSQFRATLVAPALVSEVTVTFPATTGSLLTTSTGLVLGGNAAAVTFGSSDASNVGIVANSNRSIHVYGEATPAAAQGNIQIGTNVLATAEPSTTLVLDGAFSVRPPAVVNVDVTGTTITVGNRSFIIVENPAGGAVADLGNVTLSSGLSSGQVVVIAYRGVGSITLTNFTAGSGVLDNRDVGTFVWDGTTWRALHRKDNN